MNEKNIDDINNREDLRALNEYSETFLTFYKDNITPTDIYTIKNSLKILQGIFLIFLCILNIIFG